MRSPIFLLGAAAGIAAATISPWFLLYLLFPVIWDLAKENRE